MGLEFLPRVMRCSKLDGGDGRLHNSAHVLKGTELHTENSELYGMLRYNSQQSCFIKKRE